MSNVDKGYFTEDDSVDVVNGRMSDRSLRGYRWLSRLIAWPPPGVVRRITHIQSGVSTLAAMKSCTSPGRSCRRRASRALSDSPESSPPKPAVSGWGAREW